MDRSLFHRIQQYFSEYCTRSLFCSCCKVDTTQSSHHLFSSILSVLWEPKCAMILSYTIVMISSVADHLYATDRLTLFHICLSKTVFIEIIACNSWGSWVLWFPCRSRGYSPQKSYVQGEFIKRNSKIPSHFKASKDGKISWAW